MEDPLTEDPPPSRFFDEDLNNFTPQSPPLSSPSILLSNPKTPMNPSPSLLIIALSSPSIHLLHQIPSKTLIGTLILPEITINNTPIENPSPKDKSCYIYSLKDIVLVSVQYSVSAERSHAVAKCLFECIGAEKVLILDSVQSQNFRGRLPPDEELMFKLETAEERCSEEMIVKGVDYFPSGSLIDGLGASFLARCQMKKLRATLCVSWPESGRYAVSKVKSVLEELLPEVKFNVSGSDLGFYRIKNSRFNSELYT
ncbi:hypothetical protein ACHQM5_016307 [Ranunculus cassubicifolius]